MRKLTIVVACTDRKSLRPPPELRVRSLPKGSVNRRLRIWTDRVSSEELTVPLRDLYQGEAWSQVGCLEATARARGFAPTVLVASAGLGLRRVDDRAPGYAATFATANPDSVAVGASESRQWWTGLNSHDEALHLDSVGRRVLLVLSEAYAKPLHEDLVALGMTAPDALLVGGAAEIDGMHRLPSDRKLRASLGGTTTSLNLRMAQAWLECSSGPGLVTPSDAVRWARWVNRHRRDDPPARKPLTDDEVRRFIRKGLRSDPGLSASRALRLYRESGHACEQRRFGALFVDVVRES